MKKIICLFIILVSTFSFAANNQSDRNEDEEGTLSTEQPRNSSRSEVDALRGRRAAPRRSQYPPDNRNLERKINRRRNSSAARSQNSSPQNENPDEVGRRAEKRSFSRILSRFENQRRRHENVPRLPWSDNSYRSKKKKKVSKLKLALSLSHRDILIIKKREGFELYIRKKKYINSVILTNVSGNFSPRNANISEYTLRSKNHIKTNSSSQIKYKGRLIGKKEKLYFLASSSVVKHKVFKKAFKIFVPSYVIYGYKWENFATMLVSEGVSLNIRTFRLKHGDYKRGFSDNVITVDTVLYSGRDMFAPTMRLYYLSEGQDFITAYIAYYDNNKYFKGFYVSEDASPEIELFFSSNSTPKDLRGILLISKYDLITKKTVKFKLFIEKKDTVRKIIVTGEDTSGNRAVVPIVINVPKKGRTSLPAAQAPASPSSGGGNPPAPAGQTSASSSGDGEAVRMPPTSSEGRP